jgi:hypothetical protein
MANHLTATRQVAIWPILKVSSVQQNFNLIGGNKMVLPFINVNEENSTFTGLFWLLFSYF